jgi:hypothetical protein
VEEAATNRLRKVHRRLSYANVMATAAVFVALGGSSYAAAEITGKGVRDGSLTGADIRNNSLASAHICDETKAARSGDGGVGGGLWGRGVGHGGGRQG